MQTKYFRGNRPTGGKNYGPTSYSSSTIIEYRISARDFYTSRFTIWTHNDKICDTRARDWINLNFVKAYLEGNKLVGLNFTTSERNPFPRQNFFFILPLAEFSPSFFRLINGC
jgi:hypothetical protein